ncbi:MAG: hypothetical protein PHQ76_02915 [Caldisericia bacterium]|nr:hypothetical protein [Caldisericia bacterium]MDD3427787.1 hypothetical protein [Caldisericia bacterium]MDD5689214.1 hypothetical protein [Caldisericia bacterium]HOJ16139.1 hypothetical protein [Caldisericia bacterium]HPO28906.1 hypothetical protein [Caldisericia bacterium]
MILTNILINKKCKYCECFVNDYVDGRLSRIKEEEFLAHIENCFKVKGCKKCIELVKQFKIIKSYCENLRDSLTMPEDLSINLLRMIR